MIYRNEFEVDVHDVDYNGVAKTSALMRYMQASAQSQLTSGGMSYDELKRMNRAFLLSRITMEFTESVRAYDKVSALTFPCESRGFSFLRCYALEREGRTIGRAVSVWALIDTESKSLVPVNDFDLRLTTHEPHGLQLSRFAVPSELVEVGKYRVCYGDTDRNMHMNNTAYPNMYSTFLPLEGKRIHTISINYRNEAPMGAILSVHHTESSGAHYFRTVREDGLVNSEAKIILADL